MGLAELAVFALAFLVAAAAPGPTTAALVARVLASGARGIVPFCAGLVLGDLAWLCAALLGLAVLAATMQPLFLVLKYLGAAYLLWLAFRLWTAPAAAPHADAGALPEGGGALRGVALGIALTLGNPKTMLFFLALMPSVVSAGGITAAGGVQLALVVLCVYPVVLAAYVLAAARLRKLFRSARAVRAANRGAAAVMGGAAVAIATR